MLNHLTKVSEVFRVSMVLKPGEALLSSGGKGPPCADVLASGTNRILASVLCLIMGGPRSQDDLKR